MSELAWILTGVIIGAGGVWMLRDPIDGFLFRGFRPKSVAKLLKIHFRPTPVSDITVVEVQDADRAVDEMLFTGGSLNVKLLGAGRIGFEPRTA